MGQIANYKMSAASELGQIKEWLRIWYKTNHSEIVKRRLIQIGELLRDRDKLIEEVKELREQKIQGFTADPGVAHKLKTYDRALQLMENESDHIAMFFKGNLGKAMEELGTTKYFTKS